MLWLLKGGLSEIFKPNYRIDFYVRYKPALLCAI